MTNYNTIKMLSFDCINQETVLPYKEEVLNIKEELEYA